jgi:hypothetical protein
MVPRPVDYASPPLPPATKRLHPVVWLIFLAAAIGVAGVVVLMVAYENVPFDQEPPPLTLALIDGLFLGFAALSAVIVVWAVRTKWIQHRGPAAYNAADGITS